MVAEKLKELGWRFLDWMMPRVIQRRIEDRVRLGTIQSTMEYMDATGLTHCQWCPQRFSLTVVNKDAPKTERILACPKHYKTLKKHDLTGVGNAKN